MAAATHVGDPREFLTTGFKAWPRPACSHLGHAPAEAGSLSLFLPYFLSRNFKRRQQEPSLVRSFGDGQRRLASFVFVPPQRRFLLFPCTHLGALPQESQVCSPGHLPFPDVHSHVFSKELLLGVGSLFR